MALNSTAATAVATAIVTALAIPPPANVAAIASWTIIVQKIFDGIVTNAVVTPITLPSVTPTLLSAAPGTPVTGTGGIV